MLLNSNCSSLLYYLNRLERITLEVEGTYSYDIKLSCKVHIHLRAAISNTQDTSKRFLGTFKEWKYHSSSLYLHESDYSNFNIFEETELRLFSESLLNEVSILRAFSDVEWTLIMSRENELFSEAIDINRKKHVL
ncbi:unnamed protein product [Penicillium nalgiovense]|nr:unnamed protein product [Penicillium nalgiovense]